MSSSYYNPKTDPGYVRLLISDVSNGDDRLFDDGEIAEFLSREGGDVKRAAATALIVMAGNEVLLAKAIRTQDLQTDGPKVAAELRQLAAQYRAEADAVASDSADPYAVVAFTPYSAQVPELTERRYL